MIWSNLHLLLSFSISKHMSVAFRVIHSNCFWKQCTQNHPQYLSGLSRALFPTTFLETSCISHFHISHNAPYLAPPTQILHKHCFQFLLGRLRLRAVSLFSRSVAQNARDTKMTTRVTEGPRRERHCRPRFSRLAASPLNARARALSLLNLKKKRDCSQSRDGCNTQEKWKTKVMQDLGGGGNKVHYGKCGSAVWGKT